MRRTKIVCTIGPATSSEERIGAIQQVQAELGYIGYTT
jgi:pyruvate kinase